VWYRNGGERDAGTVGERLKRRGREGAVSRESARARERERQRKSEKEIER